PAAMLQDGAAPVSLHQLVGGSPRMTLLLMHGPTRQPALSAIGAEIAKRWAQSVGVRDLVLGTGDPMALGDRDGSMYRAWRVRGAELALLRPDGHVAVRAPVTAVAALRAYLVQWFGEGAR